MMHAESDVISAVEPSAWKNGRWVGFALLMLFLTWCQPVDANDSACSVVNGKIDEAIHFVDARFGDELDNVCIRIISPDTLMTLVVRRNGVIADLPEPDGAFDPKTSRIYLSDRLDLSNVYDMSYLVHELVHLHQSKAGSIRGGLPRGLAEYEAYSVQAEFLRKHDRDQEAFLVQLLGLLQGTSDYEYRP